MEACILTDRCLNMLNDHIAPSPLHKSPLKRKGRHMTKKHRKAPNLGLIIGILGCFAGIALLFSENWFIGLFGSIASAGIALKGYQDLKQPQEKE